MAGIVVECAASLGLRQSPCPTLWPQNYGAIGLHPDVMDSPQRAGAHDARRLPKGADEPEVVTDLSDQPLAVGQSRQAFTVIHIEHERFFAKDMQATLKSLLNHGRV